MSTNLLSIVIESTSLKFLANQGEKVSGWANIPINPGFLKGGFIADSNGLAGVLKTALGKKEFNGRYRIFASVPAFHSVCRTMELPKLKEIDPRVAIPQQARRDLGYSAENSLLFWQSLPGGVDRQRFLVLSVPKEPVVNLIETLKLAGLRPHSVETTTFALCRAINQSQAVIAAVEPHSLEIVVMRGGVPLVIRSTFLGETPRNIETFPELVTDALEPVLNFYNESNPDNPLPPDIPVYLLGSAVIINPNIISAVEKVLGRPVAVFEPPLVYPQDFPKAELAANIGLVLKGL